MISNSVLKESFQLLILWEEKPDLIFLFKALLV